MKYLVTVADDYGLTEGVNRGCIDAHNNGILREMSLMMDSPATESGVKEAEANNIKGLGIHITLNDIVGTGVYMRTPDYKELLANETSEKLSNRVKDELKKFEDLVGRVPTHINGHHSCYADLKVIDTVLEYAKDNNIFVRRYRKFTDGKSVGVDINELLTKNNVKVTDHIFEYISGTYEEAFDGFIQDIKDLEESSSTELFFHPAYVDEDLRGYSSLLEDRERDLKLLTDESFIRELKDMGFEVVGFGDM